MLSRMFQAYLIVAAQFNQYISPIFTFIGFLFLNAVVTIGLMLDHLFFPAIRKQKIVSPIVIVGNPRSGTTFLQRFLAANGFGTGMRVWKMLYPSLTLQIFVRPFLPLLEKISPARHHSHAAHETNLTEMETDDPSILFRFFDGFFLYGFFFAWSKENTLDMFLPENRDTSERDFNWLERMWRRNLVGEKQNRVVSKLFSLSMRLPAFLRKFPDAKILYMVRDPLDTVPSGLSLVTGVLDGRYGFWKLPQEQRQHYIDKMYDALLHLSLKFHADYTAGRISENNLYLVKFPRMMKEFDTVMTEIMDFVDQSPTPELLETIKQISDKQKAYKSGHKYDLAKFGLTEERIKKDYAPIYETFLSDC